MNGGWLSHSLPAICGKSGRLYARKIRSAMKINRLFAFILAFAAVASAFSVAGADELPWSQRMANAAIARWPNGRFTPSGAPSKWNYELGTLLEGMDAVWLSTADRNYFNYIKDSVDQLVAPDGSIPTLKTQDHELDNILLGRQIAPSLPRDAKQALSDRCHISLSATQAAATESRWRILAQAALPQPDVARWPLYGRAISCGIRLDLASSGGIHRHHPSV